MSTFFLILAIYIATMSIINAIQNNGTNVSRPARGYYHPDDPRPWEDRHGYWESLDE